MTEPETESPLTHYRKRMLRALDHIDRNLDADLPLEAIAGVAAFSKFHFHRQFRAIFGLSVQRYAQLARMKRAGYRLAFRDAPVTQIALDAGYDAPDAFARAFRRRLGQRPSDFRKSPDWEAWHAAFGPLDDARTMLMTHELTPADVTIRDMPPVSVAIMRHRGDPSLIGDTIRRFIDWRRAHGFSPRTSATYNIFHSDPRSCAPEDYTLDLCVAAPASLAQGEGIVAGEIPGGRCAVLRVVGRSDDLEGPAGYLYREWLPQSGEEARDFPLYCQRISFFPEVPEHEAVTEIYLPLET